MFRAMPPPPRKRAFGKNPNPRRPKPAQGLRTPPEQGWDPVAKWYDRLVGETGSDYHRNVILPAALRLIQLERGESAVDICCGQGVLIKPLLDAGAAQITAIDASPQLIRAARQRHPDQPAVSWFTADACEPGEWNETQHDVAASIMAVHDVADAEALCRQAARALKVGGRMVMIAMHPCFRLPRHSHWGWDQDQKVQFRRMDRYSSPTLIEIATHPGQGGTSSHTQFYHRPLADLLNAIGNAGMAVTHCEELCSHRRSQGGGAFSKAEHRAAEEFPLFIALRAVRQS